MKSFIVRTLASRATIARAFAAIAFVGLFTAACEPGNDVHGPIASSIATITISPNPQTLAVTGTQQFTAVGKDANGNVVAFTPTWSIATGGGTINSAGLFTAGTAAGTFANTVTASNGTVSASATVMLTAGALTSITVTPGPSTLAIGGTQQFVATGKDASGNVIALTPTWTVAASGGTVNSTGMFTAGNTVGSFVNTVTATSGTISGTATVNVTGGAIASMVISPNPATMSTGATQQFTAVGKDAGGNTVAVTPTWSIVNVGGTINATTGLFTAGAFTGTFTNTVKATSGTLSASATVVVTQPAGALVTIAVTPNPATLNPNATQQFTAVGKDGNGTVVAITPVWSVVNGGGTINSGGLFTAGATAGTFNSTVQATSGGIAGTATVVVSSPTPPSLVNLGAAAPNGVMAGTAFTCVSLGTINADIAISPGSTVTGFPPCVITGVRHLADAVAAQAQIDLTAAYNTLMGQPCPPANAIVANLGGTTKPAGVYCTASGIGVTGTLTLDGGGNPNATFVFQAGTSLTTAGNVVLINGASAKNVYWVIGSSATIGTASQWQGNVITLTSITLVDNATLLGRALARNGAVSLGTNNVITLP
jgi:Ice-binding-like